MTHKTQRIKLFLKNDSKNFFPWLKEFNLFFFFWIWLDFFWKYFLTQRIEPFSNMTQRIELLSWLRIELFLWLKELSSFFQNDSKILLNTTQRIELFFEYDSKYWTSFSIWLKELNLLLANDSKTWTLFYKCLKELNLSWKRKRWLEELICSKISIKL